MLSHIKIGKRITALIAISVAGLVLITIIAIASTSATQRMLSRTEIDALRPIEQISQLNEAMQEAFRQLLLALQHNPVLPAAKIHDHPISLHTSAMEKAIVRMNDALRDYKSSGAGSSFREMADQIAASEARLIEDGLRPVAQRIMSGDYRSEERRVGKEGRARGTKSHR